jgi:hypothetical protein
MAEKDEIRIERSGLPCSRPGWALNSGVNRTVCSPRPCLFLTVWQGFPPASALASKWKARVRVTRV